MPPFLTCLFCLSKMGGLKNNWFFETEVTFLLDWATWRAGAKRQKNIYDEPLTLGIPRQRVGWNNGVAERLKYREACLVINSRLFLPFAFFLLRFSYQCFLFYLLYIVVLEGSSRVFCWQHSRRDGDCSVVFQPYFSSLHSVRALIFVFSSLCLLLWFCCQASCFATGNWYFGFQGFFGGY